MENIKMISFKSVRSAEQSSDRSWCSRQGFWGKTIVRRSDEIKNILTTFDWRSDASDEELMEKLYQEFLVQIKRIDGGIEDWFVEGDYRELVKILNGTSKKSEI